VFVVTVRFLIKAGHEESFLRRVGRQAQESLDREPGCRQFDVCVRDGAAGRVFLYEVYTDSAAFDAHLRAAHFLAFDADTRGWIDEKIAETWTLAPASRAASPSGDSA
jgi:quinol monooxygenase YgiN